MARPTEGPTNAIMMGEYGTDPDEKLSLFLFAALARQGYVNPLAVIGNHAHALLRAQDAKFTLSSVGLPYVPVGMGDHGFAATSKDVEDDPRFLAPATQLQHGREVLRWTLQHAADNSVTLVLNSGFTDAVWLWMDSPDLFKRKVCEVVIMGGVEMDGDWPLFNHEGFMVPSLGKTGAANNVFDPGATLHMYDLVQRHQIPTVFTTRHLAYGCMIPFGLYTQLAETGHAVGIRLDEKQRASIDGLWKRANAPEGSAERGSLPLRCDRSWFVKTFCDGNDPGIDADGDIVPFMARVALYDPLNLIAAIPVLREQFCRPAKIEVKGVDHQVIGLTDAYNGVRDEAGLRQLVVSGMVSALRYGRTPILAT